MKNIENYLRNCIEEKFGVAPRLFHTNFFWGSVVSIKKDGKRTELAFCEKQDATCVVFATQFPIELIRGENTWITFRVLISPNEYERFNLDTVKYPIFKSDTMISSNDFEAFKSSLNIDDLKIGKNAKMAAALQNKF